MLFLKTFYLNTIPKIMFNSAVKSKILIFSFDCLNLFFVLTPLKKIGC